MVLQGLYKNGLHPICYLVHNLFKLNVLYLLYVNLIAVYRMGLSLDLCYMFCMPCQWLLNFSLTFSKARKSALRTRLLATGCEAGGWGGGGGGKVAPVYYIFIKQATQQL